MESLLEGQADEIEQMLWTTLRTLKERLKITRQMADEARDNNEQLKVQHFEKQAQQALQRAELIRQALLKG
jgi:anaerobic ribonucleoside-triphosphate reductase